MLKKIVSLMLALAMVASMTLCASAENLSCGTPWIASDLDGAVTEGMTFDLKDDFAAALNGEWAVTAEYADGQNIAGTMADIEVLTERQLRDMVTGENVDNDADLAMVQSLYELYADWDARNAAGTSPLMPVLEKLEAIQNIDELNAFLTLPAVERGFMTGPFQFDTEIDTNDSSRYTMVLTGSWLLMGYADEYSEMDESGETIREGVCADVRVILKEAGYSDERIEEIITNAFAFEYQIAPYYYGLVDMMSPDYTQKSNNPMTRAELQEAEGNLPIIECMLASGVKDEALTDVILYNPGWLEALKSLYTDENVAGMRDLIIVNYVLDHSDELDRTIWDVDRAESDAKNGTEKSVDQCAVEYAETQLSWSLAKAYVRRYFAQEDKDRVYQMCVDIIAEYRTMLQEEDFLSQETINYAIEKLDAMQIFSLYPDDDQWPDTSSLTFKSKAEGGTLWDAMMAIREYNLQHSLSLMGQKTDRTRWSETALPTQVNASNNIGANAIQIYAAICQGGVYHTGMSDEELYASLGAVVGHEISHAFDSTGAQYDKTGTVSNWWTDEDYAKFQEKVQKIEDYYNTIIPWEGQQVHGSIVTGEACADIAGLKVMLRMAKKIDGFDYDKFFRAYANLWKAKKTMEAELKNLNNVHPLNYLRINVTLAQQPEFVETYGLQEGDGMYIAPEDRIAIW